MVKLKEHQGFGQGNENPSYKHGMHGTLTYKIWKKMRERCNNPNNTNYKRYGDKGIKVCERWEDFINFYTDMGERPSKDYSIDRIDGNGNYEPLNCRWATREEQNNNKRTNVFIEHNGKRQTINQWSRETGLSRHAIRYRLSKGFSPEKILDPNDRRIVK